jgi:hypothetical protein
LGDAFSAGTGIPAQEAGLPPDGGIAPDAEISDLDLDANLSLDFPPEDEEKAAGPPDSPIDDSFARLIPEGYEEKAPEPPLPAGDSLEEEDILDTGILAGNEGLEAELLAGDIAEDIAAGAGESADPDSVFDLSPGLDEDALAAGIEIPEISMDLGAEFDTAAFAAEEDITIDIPADTEGGDSAAEEPIEFDFAEEPFELPAMEDLSPAGGQDAAEEEALPDITVEEEPVIELPVEDESLFAEFDEFSVEMPEDVLDGDSLGGEIPDIPTLEAAPPETAKPGVPAGSALSGVPEKIQEELKTVLSYMDRLLESLPEEKIEEFAKSEYFDTYKKLFEDLGLV